MFKPACTASQIIGYALSAFCKRALVAGLLVSRALAIIDTLHPVYEGRVFRWGDDESQPPIEEYGRTDLPESASGLDATAGGTPPETIARWRASPFFYLLQTDRSFLRRRLTAESESEFPIFPELPGRRHD